MTAQRGDFERPTGPQPGNRDEVCARCTLPRSTRVHGNPFGAGHAFEVAPSAGQDTERLRDELNDDWWTALYLATSDAVDGVPYAAASEYPVPHVEAFRAAAEAFLLPVLGQRDEARAQVQRVRELVGSYDNGQLWSSQVVDLVRRALDGQP